MRRVLYWKATRPNIRTRSIRWTYLRTNGWKTWTFGKVDGSDVESSTIGIDEGMNQHWE